MAPPPPVHMDLCVMPAVLFFLALDDLLRVGAVCRVWRVKCHGLRKKVLRRWGIAPALRLRYWSWCAGVDVLFASESQLLSEYKRCLGSIDGLSSLASTGTEGEIARDVTRTFQRIAFFSQADSQSSLANILKAVSVYASVVGYCQGMNYVTAILLKESENDPRSSTRLREARVFGLMCGFIFNLDMKDLWRPGVPQLKLRIFQFDRLLQQTQPHLAAHFKQIGLSPDFFASQWFLTLLSYNVPREQLVRVWDLLFSDGWKTIFRVGIAILQGLEAQLTALSLEETSTFFKNGHLNRITADLVASSVSVTGVKTKGLLELENLYVAHVLAQQLSDSPDIHGSVAFVDRRIAALVRQEIARLDGPVRADVNVLRNRIEQTERALKEARAVFILEAREFVEVQADVEELQEAKRAISSQILALASTDDENGDLPLLQAKVEAIDTQLSKESARFGGVLWRTSQAQIDLEEALERKAVFSEQLRLVLDHNEASRVERIKALFRELNVGGKPAA